MVAGAASGISKIVASLAVTSLSVKNIVISGRSKASSPTVY